MVFGEKGTSPRAQARGGRGVPPGPGGPGIVTATFFKGGLPGDGPKTTQLGSPGGEKGRRPFFPFPRAPGVRFPRGGYPRGPGGIEKAPGGPKRARGGKAPTPFYPGGGAMGGPVSSQVIHPEGGTRSLLF